MDDQLLFAQDDEEEAIELAKLPWKLLVIDDEEEIHQITKMVLSDFTFDQRGIEIHSAHSAAEARELLEQDEHHQIAVALVDVVMETSHAGLELIQWVRETLHNHTIRLVLRTGQPGEAPEERVIRDYDINDYKNKTELTALRLKTTVFAALRGYRDLRIIERHKLGLEKIITASTEFIECDSLAQFASTILRHISLVLGIESKEIVCCAASRESDPMNKPEFKVLATNIGNDKDPMTAEVRQRIHSALREQKTIHEDDFFVGYFTTKRGSENVLYVARDDTMEVGQHELLSFFANNIAVAYENLKLREMIRESQRELSYVIGEAVEMRSKETGSHVKRVAHISYLLAKHYGLTESDAEMIKLASPLHDVGKVGIPDYILNKPGKHDIDEFEIMQTHAQIGYDMLIKSDNPILQLGAEIALQHHECWDGSGYPNGLKGAAIHIAGRISAVADVFDALGSKRCYKGPWSNDEIKRYFEQQRGTQFEPKLVDLVLENFDEFCAIRLQFPDQDEQEPQS